LAGLVVVTALVVSGCGSGSSGRGAAGSNATTTTGVPGASTSGGAGTTVAGRTPASVDLSPVSSILSNVDKDIADSTSQTEDDPSK
jgi:hypothetical protein